MRRLAQILVLLGTVISCAVSALGSEPAKARPVVVIIYADWCPYCQHLKPALARIKEKYNGRISFVRLDVTNEATTAQSRLLAHKLGLEQFFEDNKTATSLVVIQDPSGREVFRALHDYDFEHYEAVLDQQLGPKPVSHRN